MKVFGAMGVSKANYRSEHAWYVNCGVLAAIFVSVPVGGLGQCLSGEPSAYLLGEQVAVHVMDSECSFDSNVRKVFSDPSVEGLALVFHRPISGAQSIQLATGALAIGQTVAVWGLDGKPAAMASITVASDVGGDYSAFMATLAGSNCGSVRVGAVLTLPDEVKVVGLVRKVLVGPRCILHVIKASAIRPLLSVQVPQGVPLVTLNNSEGQLPLRIAYDPGEELPARTGAAEAQALGRIYFAGTGRGAFRGQHSQMVYHELRSTLAQGGVEVVVQRLDEVANEGMASISGSIDTARKMKTDGLLYFSLAIGWSPKDRLELECYDQDGKLLWKEETTTLWQSTQSAAVRALTKRMQEKLTIRIRRGQLPGQKRSLLK